MLGGAETSETSNYLRFGVQDDDFNLWNNPAFVRFIPSQGSEIELHETEPTTIHLKLISKNVTDRIQQKLGTEA